MRKDKKTHITPFLFIVLIILSLLSTAYLYVNGGFSVGVGESLSNIQSLDPLPVKEVSFAEFLVNTFRKFLVGF